MDELLPPKCDMGVDHGGDTGDKSTPEFGVGDTSANCPPQIFVI